MMQVHSTILTILSIYILTMAYDAGTQHYTHNTINIYILTMAYDAGTALYSQYYRCIYLLWPMMQELRDEYAQNHAEEARESRAVKETKAPDGEEGGGGEEEGEGSDTDSEEGFEEEAPVMPATTAPSKTKFSSDSALLRRESLKFEPAILRLLQSLWVAVDADGSGAVEKAEYFTWMKKMCYLLIGVEGHDYDYKYEQVGHTLDGCI
jgi:hypothetical protein